jgi:hypothetical protein
MVRAPGVEADVTGSAVVEEACVWIGSAKKL